ncbi:MAG: signal recognition particle protein [Chloroflexota bacterium]|nr:signal recognition particle protein [Chloroflexota bacterium]
MFEQLSDRLTATFGKLQGRPRVTDADLDAALRDVRIALLEADVNFKVVRQLVATVRERAIGERVLESVTGAQQVVKIVHDALVEMLGGEAVPLARAQRPPTVIVVVGLQGSGKTTSVAKLANHLRKQGRRPALVAADVHRPAAVAQLQTLGRQLALPVKTVRGESIADDVASQVAAAAREDRDVVVVDTAGRLHIDEAMMLEVEAIVAAARPDEVLLVVDAMAGQDAVDAATAFKARLRVSGLLLAKVDSDARGGASLSVRAATGVPVKFLGTSEKLDGLEVFHPDRLARRILGMGDILTLVERAQEHVDVRAAEEQAKRLLDARFTFDDFYSQLQQVKKMGPIADLMKMIPGMGAIAKDLPDNATTDAQLRLIEAIISSMTKAERGDPTIINGSRRRRIAAGSGATVPEVNQLLKQFEALKKQMKQLGPLMKSGRLPRFPGMRT